VAQASICATELAELLFATKLHRASWCGRCAICTAAMIMAPMSLWLPCGLLSLLSQLLSLYCAVTKPKTPGLATTSSSAGFKTSR